MAPPLTNLASLRHVWPEAILAAGALALVALGAAGRRPSRRLAAAVTLGACALALLALRAGAGSGAAAPAHSLALFGALLARDRFADYFKVIFLIATAAVTLLSVRGTDAVEEDDRHGDAYELHALLLAAALAMCLMAGATDLLLAYLAFELLSICSYLMTGFARSGPRAAEAALKYVVYGGVASGAMLYGLSLLYGLAAGTGLPAVQAAMAAAPPAVTAVALALVMAGFGFKIAAVPFHMWAPDVYEGAPTAVAAFLSVASKAAGFALLLRFFGGHSAAAAAAAGARAPATLLFAVASVATMTLGNLAALSQSRMRRLLAYSSIAHAGYVLMAIAAGTAAAGQAALFYLGVYLFMNLGAFAVVLAVAEAGGGDTVASYAGLGRRAPFAAACMTVALFSLTGLPPFAGFVGKYTLFAAVVSRGLDGGGPMFHLLALIGVANSVVSLYYYARVIRSMYLDGAGSDRAGTPATVAPLPIAPIHRAVLGAVTLPTVLLGLYWEPLAELVTMACASR